MSVSVSMKDRKAVIYGEVEALRALLDQRDQQIATQAETIARRDAQIAALRAESEERKAKSEERRCQCIDCYGTNPHHDPDCEYMREHHGDREVALSKMEIGKRLAILLKRTVRNAPDGKFESFANGEWSEVPQRIVRHACGGAA